MIVSLAAEERIANRVRWSVPDSSPLPVSLLDSVVAR